jgi:hypothetical protein
VLGRRSAENVSSFRCAREEVCGATAIEANLNTLILKPDEQEPSCIAGDHVAILLECKVPGIEQIELNIFQILLDMFLPPGRCCRSSSHISTYGNRLAASE